MGDLRRQLLWLCNWHWLAVRRAARVDSVQAEIVEGLRQAGYRVEIIGRPVDLLVGKAFSHWGDPLCTDALMRLTKVFHWTLMEIKTPTKTGARRVRRDQEAQDRFIEETRTPVVTSLASAINALEGL